VTSNTLGRARPRGVGRVNFARTSTTCGRRNHGFYFWNPGPESFRGHRNSLVLTTVWSLLPTVRLLQTSVFLLCPLLFALAIFLNEFECSLTGRVMASQNPSTKLHKKPFDWAIGRCSLGCHVLPAASVHVPRNSVEQTSAESLPWQCYDNHFKRLEKDQHQGL